MLWQRSWCSAHHGPATAVIHSKARCKVRCPDGSTYPGPHPPFAVGAGWDIYLVFALHQVSLPMERFERFVFTFLTWVLYLYVSIEVVELLITLGKALWTVDLSAERTFLSTAEGHRTLPLFFNILIAMELAETMKEFHLDHRVKVVRLLSIGVIAISRKLIVADLTHGDPMVTFSIAALVASLVVGIRLLDHYAKDGRKADETPSAER